MPASIYFYYLLAINLITFGIFGFDKLAAIRHERRVREATLIGFSIVGGSVGGLIAMFIFRHKIRKPKFFIGIPVIMAAQVAIGYCLSGMIV